MASSHSPGCDTSSPKCRSVQTAPTSTTSCHSTSQKPHLTDQGPSAKADHPHSGQVNAQGNARLRSTGGGFAVLVQARRASLTWTNVSPAVFRSSSIATRGFCSKCGSPLFLQYDGDDLVRLTAGSLDHPERIQPAGHYGVESRLPWADIGQGLPEEETKERF
ncbi:GFA family protein (plasmid) [Shinella yambaruensis]|uniref:GFA family protein n=1 Tax=Shinella yambaruensis TaxID=415996 RepID=UPI003D7BE591